MPSLSLTNEHSFSRSPQREVIEQRQFLTFVLADDVFAMPIENIREIIEFVGLTEVPLMPNFLRGVINLRGAVVPVIDLSVRFGRPLSVVGKRTCIVIMEVMQDEKLLLLGVMVDAVSAVLMIDLDKIEGRPSFGARIRSDFIEGMINIKDRFVVALDIKAVLSVDEMATLIGMAVADGFDASANE